MPAPKHRSPLHFLSFKDTVNFLVDVLFHFRCKALNMNLKLRVLMEGLLLGFGYLVKPPGWIFKFFKATSFTQ